MADTHVALNRFDPSPAGDSFFGGQSPRDIEQLGLRARATFDWAEEPLRLRSVSDTATVAELVGHQAILNLGVAFDVWKRVTFTLDVPFAISQHGDDSVATLPTANGAHIGDTRIGARVFLFQLAPLFRVSVAGTGWLPIGATTDASGAYMSDHHARARVEAIVHGDSGRFVWALSVGNDFRRQQRFVNVHNGSTVRITAGAAVRFFDNRVQVGPEFYGSLHPEDNEKFNRQGEILLGARYRVPRGIDAGIAAGPGITSGMGTPDWRFVANVGWAFGWDKPAPKAPAEPVVVPAPQPEPQPEPVAPPPPPAPDRDSDGVPDARDACVDVPGDLEHDGCPAVLDTDGDGIVEEVDACPADAGVADADPARNGCPAARVVGDKIVIMDAIQFENNKSVIKADSEVVLLAILKAINSVPTSARFVVEGHTDSRGNAKRNKVLSEARAQAVVAWLAAHGVDATRFTAEGYGPAKPIADNKTEAGRKTNRRVEIQIVR